MASPTSIKRRLFHDKLEEISNIVCLGKTEQSQTEELIRLVIANKAQEATGRLTAQLNRFNEPVILGCTELSVIADTLNLTNILDPLQLVVDRIFINRQAEITPVRLAKTSIQ